jgi:hypothetical protein
MPSSDIRPLANFLNNGDLSTLLRIKEIKTDAKGALESLLQHPSLPLYKARIVNYLRENVTKKSVDKFKDTLLKTLKETVVIEAKRQVDSYILNIAKQKIGFP